jgi:DNA-binding NtrC family response regulator
MRRETFNVAACAFLGWGAFALLLAALYRNNRRSPAVSGTVPGSPPVATAENAQDDEIKPIWLLEKEAIMQAVDKLNGDKLLAATKLGIGKTTLYRKMKKYGIALEGTFRTLQQPPRNEIS